MDLQMQITVLVPDPLLKAKPFTFFLSERLYEVQESIKSC